MIIFDKIMTIICMVCSVYYFKTDTELSYSFFVIGILYALDTVKDTIVEEIKKNK